MDIDVYKIVENGIESFAFLFYCCHIHKNTLLYIYLCEDFIDVMHYPAAYPNHPQ